MSEQGYEGIYNILNELKEDINRLKLDNANSNSKLDSLSEQVKKLSEDHGQLRGIISTGTYGRNSLLEEVKVSHSKINYLEGKLESAKSDISVLEDRWVKFLWAMSIAILLIIISEFISKSSESNSAFPVKIFVVVSDVFISY